MIFRRLFARLLGRHTGRPGPPCRLARAEALRIAGSALGSSMPLYVRDVVEVGGQLEWHIGTATVGSGTVVRISDATGEVIDRYTWGKR